MNDEEVKALREELLRTQSTLKQMQSGSSTSQPASLEPGVTETVAHVSVRPPPFLHHHAAGWFRILEAQFILARVSVSGTRFNHALSALPADIVAKIPATLLESSDYDGLKTAVLDQFEQSKTEIFNQLTSKAELHGRPSQFLAELQSQAARVGVGPDLVRHRFLQAMPKNLTPVLVAQAEMTLEALGKLADSLREHLPETEVMAVSTFEAHPRRERRHSRERESRNQQFRRDEDRSQGRTAVYSFRPNQRPQVCRAHVFFADRARTCTSWCKFPCDKRRLTVRSSRSQSRSPSPQQENCGGK